MLTAYLLTDYSLPTIQKQNSTEKDLCFFSDADVLASLIYTDLGGRLKPKFFKGLTKSFKGLTKSFMR